jgi:hypothetical protein
LSKNEFVSKANSTCTQAIRKLGAALFNGGLRRTDSDVVNKDVIPILERNLIDPIDALGAPKGDEDKVDAMLAAGKQAAASLKRNPHLIRAVGGPGDPFLKFQRLARAYGLNRCAR